MAPSLGLLDHHSVYVSSNIGGAWQEVGELNHRYDEIGVTGLSRRYSLFDNNSGNGLALLLTGGYQSRSYQNFRFNVGSSYFFRKGSEIINVGVDYPQCKPNNIANSSCGYGIDTQLTSHTIFPLQVGVNYSPVKSLDLGFTFYLPGITLVSPNGTITWPPETQDSFEANTKNPLGGKCLALGLGANLGVPIAVANGKLIVEPEVRFNWIVNPHLPNQSDARDSHFLSYTAGLQVLVPMKPTPKVSNTESIYNQELYTSLRQEGIAIEKKLEELLQKTQNSTDDFSKTKYSQETRAELNLLISNYANLLRECGEAFLKTWAWEVKVQGALLTNQIADHPLSGAFSESGKKLNDQIELLQKTAEESLGTPLPPFSPSLNSDKPAYRSENRTLSALSVNLKAEETLQQFYDTYLKYLKVQSSVNQTPEALTQSQTVVTQSYKIAKEWIRKNNQIAAAYLSHLERWKADPNLKKEVEGLGPIDFTINYYDPFGSK